MFKKLSLAGAAIAMGATALVPVSADAQRYYGQRYERGYDGYRDGYRDGGYDRYRGGDRGYYRERRGYDRCRRNDGGTGTIVGAIAGGLLGNGVAGRGDKTLGAVIGAGAGALAGRAIERSDRPGYCR